VASAARRLVAHPLTALHRLVAVTAVHKVAVATARRIRVALLPVVMVVLRPAVHKVAAATAVLRLAAATAVLRLAVHKVAMVLRPVAATAARRRRLPWAATAACRAAAHRWSLRVVAVRSGKLEIRSWCW
jgi:hypothetical protein